MGWTAEDEAKYQAEGRRIRGENSDYDAEVLDVPWARERYKLRHDAWARRHSMPPNVCRARQWVGGKLQPPCLCNSL